MLMKLRKKIKNQKGFTLVELMVVIAIIGVLAAIAVPKLTSSTNSAKVAKIQADLRTIDSALTLYAADTGVTPDTSTTIATLTTASGGKGPWLASEPKAPSGKVTVAGTEYTIDAAGESYAVNANGRATFHGLTADAVK